MEVKMKNLKVVTIGGGSSYTPELVEGFIKRYDSLPIKELWLVDIEEGREKLEIVGNLAKRMVEKAGVDMKVYLTLDRREALKDADFVTTQMRVGLLDARIKDERIPLELGMIGQETNGAGGMFKALRTIPVILDIVEDMKELCPYAWLINFTNPASMVTEAVINYGNWPKAVGLCNVPVGMKKGFSRLMKVDEASLDMELVGLNHHCFATDVFVNGQSRKEEILEIYQTASMEDLVNMTNIMGHRFSNEVLRGLDAIPCPYLSYYFFRKDQLDHQLDQFKKHDVRAEHVKEVERELFDLYKDPDLAVKPKQLEQRGGAYYSDAACSLIESIYNDRGDIQYVNVLNKDTISNFPEDAVIECAAKITKEGPKPVKVGDAPYSILGTITNIKAFEKMTVQAAVEGNRDLAIAALTMNPLVPSEALAIEVFDRLLEAHKDYLPQF